MINRLNEALELVKLVNHTIVNGTSVSKIIKGESSIDERSIRELIADEQNAVRKYEGFAATSKDPRVQKVFLSIGKEEEVHSGELEELLDVIGKANHDSFKEGSLEVQDLLSESKVERAELEGVPDSVKDKMLLDTLEEKNMKIAELEKDKSEVYLERAKLVSFLSKLYPSVLYKDPNIEGNFSNIVYVNSPKGQLSWHLCDNSLDLFSHLNYLNESPWDGHDTGEKYTRLLSISPLEAN